MRADKQLIRKQHCNRCTAWFLSTVQNSLRCKSKQAVSRPRCTPETGSLRNSVIASGLVVTCRAELRTHRSKSHCSKHVVPDNLQERHHQRNEATTDKCKSNCMQKTRNSAWQLVCRVMHGGHSCRPCTAISYYMYNMRGGCTESCSNVNQLVQDAAF